MFDVGTQKQTFADRFRKKMAERPGKPVDGGRLLRAIGRRKKWIVASIVAGLVLGLMIPYWLISHQWTAKAVMEWEQPEEEMSGGAAGAVRDLRTLVDSVKLPTNLDQVRDELGLEMTLDELGSRLEVSFDRDSNVVAVNATADTPEKSARIANAVVDVFLEHQSELARLRSREAVQELEQQVAEARQSYERSQGEYDAFRREHGISDLSLERQHAIETAAQLQAEAQMARAEAETERSQAGIATRRVVRRSPAQSAALRRAQEELEQARATLSDRHPRVQALRSRVEDLEAEAGESTTVTGGGSFRAERSRARAEEREQTYESLVEEARERLSVLSEAEGEASRLLSTVQVKEAALAEAEGELTRARAQATTANNGFRLLAAALPPEEPSSSNRRAMAVFILLGCVAFTLVAMLLWELRGLRAHTANEVAFWGRAPVLGATVWPRTDRSITPLIEELGDYALEAGGSTLVIPASSEQSGVAAQVAERLHLDTDVIDHGDSVYRDPEQDLSVTVDDAPRAAEAVVGGDPQPAAPEQGVIEVGPAGNGNGANGNGHGSSMVHVGSNGNGRAHPLALRMGDEWAPPRIAAWNGETAGPPVRRAARVADRVIVVVPSGGLSFGALERLRQSLGREDDEGIGYLLINVRDELATLPDRAGPVESFWQARRA